MTKTFKFFDIQNRGFITCDQFKRAVQKLGVVLPTGSDPQDMDMIFAHYDADGNGHLDYKELAKYIESKNADLADKIRKQAQEYQR